MIKKIIVIGLILFFGSAAVTGIIEGLMNNADDSTNGPSTSEPLSSVCAHEFTLVSDKVETCLNEGLKTFQCSICSYTYTQNTPKVEHCYELISEYSPSYVSRGQKIFKCTSCETTRGEFFGQILAPISFKVSTYEKDFLGGVTLNVVAKNNSDKTINCIQYFISFYDNIGRLIYSDFDFTKEGIYSWEIVGPIQPLETYTFSGYGFYNNYFTGNYVVEKFKITYSDGTVDIISNENFELYTSDLLVIDANANVVWSTTSAAYHNPDCELSEYNTWSITGTIQEAVKEGKTSCSICNP